MKPCDTIAWFTYFECVQPKEDAFVYASKGITRRRVYCKVDVKDDRRQVQVPMVAMRTMVDDEWRSAVSLNGAARWPVHWNTISWIRGRFVCYSTIQRCLIT